MKVNGKILLDSFLASISEKLATYFVASSRNDSSCKISNNNFVAWFDRLSKALVKLVNSHVNCHSLRLLKGRLLVRKSAKFWWLLSIENHCQHWRKPFKLYFYVWRRQKFLRCNWQCRLLDDFLSSEKFVAWLNFREIFILSTSFWNHKRSFSPKYVWANVKPSLIVVADDQQVVIIFMCFCALKKCFAWNFPARSIENGNSILCVLRSEGQDQKLLECCLERNENNISKHQA